MGASNLEPQNYIQGRASKGQSILFTGIIRKIGGLWVAYFFSNGSVPVVCFDEFLDLVYVKKKKKKKCRMKKSSYVKLLTTLCRSLGLS